MPRRHPIYPWIGQVVTAFPHLSRPQARVLALYSFGMILAQRCGLSTVATFLAPVLGSRWATIRSRLQEFYQPAEAKSGGRRAQLEVSDCFAPLLAWVLRGWPSRRLAVARDATTMGDRFTILSIGVVYRGSAIPVAWKVLPGNVAHAWRPEWIALLDRFSGLVPRGWTVVVMADRGLYARWLFGKITELGWHPLMRITHLSKFRRAGTRASVGVTTLAPEPGRRRQGGGTAFPRRPARRLDCTLLACWEPGHDQAWFPVTDLGPGQAEGLWYGMRAWIEAGFKLLKSGGWQWQKTRMTDPARADRLWLALAVATRYVRAVGGEAEADQPAPATSPEPIARGPSARVADAPRSPAGRPRRARPEASRPSPAMPKRAAGAGPRVVSAFRQGLAALVSVLIAGHALPRPHWKPEPWLELRVAVKSSPDQPPTPIPKNPSL
jgi:hypothetical protein